MKRREFIALLAGAAAAWPLAARAQQSERMCRIGVLMHTAADEPESQARLAAFMQGLQESGWAVGRNLRIDYRWSVGDSARLYKDAAELVALAPEVILGGVGATAAALQQASRTVPVVMAQGIDPVGNGYVESLAQPGSKLPNSNQREASMRLSLIMTIAVLLLSAGGAWAKTFTFETSSVGVKKVCGGTTDCTTDCGKAICDAYCYKRGCFITIYRTGPTRPTPPVHRGGSNR